MTWTGADRRRITIGGADVEVELYSLAPHGPSIRVSDLAYLQHIRSGIARIMSPTGDPKDSPQGLRYYTRLPVFARELANRVARALTDGIPDALIEIPSSREFSRPYTDALKEQFPRALDLTGTVRRRVGVKSGEGASFADLIADTEVTATNVSGIRTLVLVDDVFGYGKTIGATVVRLRETGLAADARIIVAAPLVVVHS